MKCPKCGFVSYSDLPQCKKCGCTFVATTAKEKAAPFSSPASPRKSPPRPAAPDPPLLKPPEVTPAPAATPDKEPEWPVLASTPPLVAAPPWREELSDRLEDFRRKRARLRGEFDPATSLDLDFGEASELDMPPLVAEKVVEPPAPHAVDAALPGPDKEVPVVDAAPLEKLSEGLRVLSSAAVQAGELPLESEPEDEPIVLESMPPAGKPPVMESSPLWLVAAPLSGRFVAGIADATVLLVAGALFALIFLAAGGRLTWNPTNAVVMGLLGAFFFLAYFGLFTAISSATPGLLWMSLEVRSMDGAPPTSRESFLRAFGYLVSIASLLLGFVWALVDGEKLTWHDRISGTIITTMEGSPHLRK